MILAGLLYLTTLLGVSVAQNGIEDPPSVFNSPVVLRYSDFYGAIQNGTWWIKFFSPYCSHCREFAPSWDEMYTTIGDEAAANNFYFGSVDCTVDGDICDSEGVPTYPYLKLYQYGIGKQVFVSRERAPGALIQFALETIDDLKKDGMLHEGPLVEIINSTDTEDSFAATSVETNAAFPQYTGPSEIVNSVYPTAPKAIQKVDPSLPNSLGISEKLDNTEFTRRITATKDAWFVKFFSPKCPHCQAMAPAWNQMAESMRGKINIGEVNCDVERELCKDANIELLPTMFYIDGISKTEYKGLRGYGDLVHFVNSAIDATSIRDIDSVELEKVVKENELLLSSEQEGDVNTLTYYIYFYDTSTVAEDFEALEAMAVSVIGNGKIFKSTDEKLIKQMNVKHFPSLYCVTEKKWLRYPSLSPKDIRDVGKLVDWAHEAWLSGVPQLTPSNAKEIFDHAQYVALAIIDPRDHVSHIRALKEMKATALTYMDIVAKEAAEEIKALRSKKQLKIDEAKDKGDKRAEENAERIRIEPKKKPRVGFAWIDGIFWERFLKRRYGLDKDFRGPRVIITDDHGGKFWDVNSQNQYIEASRTQLLDMVESVLGISDTRLDPKALHHSFRGAIVQGQQWVRQFWHAIMLLGLILFALVYYKRRKLLSSLKNGSGAKYHTLPTHTRQAEKFD